MLKVEKFLWFFLGVGEIRWHKIIVLLGFSVCLKWRIKILFVYCIILIHSLKCKASYGYDEISSSILKISAS